MENTNTKFRLFAKGHGVPLWRLAQEIGVSEPTMTRWLRCPLSAEREAQLREAVLVIAEEDQHE